MKHIIISCTALLAALLLLLSSCSVPGLDGEKSVLKIGVENIGPGYNPFYYNDTGDGVVMTQLYETLRRPGSEKAAEKLCGSITYEYLDDGRVKFTVSIDEGVRFADGTAATVDDIIFYYSVLGDASFDGSRAGWHNNDIAGLKEYYYDDPKWEENLAAAKADGKTEKEFIEANYADGIDVPEISGISRVNSTTCTVIFNSVDVNSVKQIEPLIVSKAVFGAGYVKGKAGAIKLNTACGGTGPYTLTACDGKKGTATLEANEYYHGGAPGFDRLEFVKTEAAKAVDALTGGKIDLAELPALQSDIDRLASKDYSYFLSDCDNYVSITFNCVNTDIGVRLGMMRLIDRTLGMGNYFGTHFTALTRPLSVRFGEYPAGETSFPFESLTAAEYFKNAGFTREGGVIGKGAALTDADGRQLKITAVCREDESEAVMKSFENCCAMLTAAGIEVESSVLSAEEYEASLKSGTADLWLGRIKEDESSDKSAHFMTGGALNYSRVSDSQLDALLKNAGGTLDKTERKLLTARALERAVALGAELPLYQQKQLTAFNTGAVDAASIPVDADPEGCRYIIRNLKPAK